MGMLIFLLKALCLSLITSVLIIFIGTIIHEIIKKGKK